MERERRDANCQKQIENDSGKKKKIVVGIWIAKSSREFFSFLVGFLTREHFHIHNNNKILTKEATCCGNGP